MGLMTRTINRQPWTVRSIDYGDTGYKYFGYSDWKGKCTNKNFIGVDQETFEDCSNVYVDRDNVLRSRPALKKNAELNKGNTLKLYTFGPWRVYKLGNPAWSTCKLVFTNDTVTLETESNVPTDCNIVLADEKIFVFANNYAKYVDTAVTPLVYKDATDLIYSPVTKTITVSGEKELESPNIWSKTHRERYIWERKIPVDLTDIVGKKVTVQVGDDGKEHTISSFQKYQEYTIAKEIMDNRPLTSLYYPIESYNTDDTPVRVNKTSAIPMIDVSKNNSIVRGKNVTKTVNSTVYSYYEIEYSVDGVVFTKLIDLPWSNSTPYNCYYIPKFSDDGTIIYVYTSAGIYAISVLSDSVDGSYRYLDWTNLCTKYGISNTVTYYEVGAAFVRNYNTFAIFTGEESTTSGITNLYSVSEGTLKSGQSSTVDTHKSRYNKIFTDGTSIVLLQSYIQNGVPGYSLYAYNAETLASIAIGGIKTVYAGDIYSALYASIYKVTEISIVVKRTAGSLTLCKLTTNVTSGSKQFVSEVIFTNNVLSPIVAESDSSILTQLTYIYNKQTILFNQGGQYSDFAIAVKNNYIYFGYFDTTSTYKVYSTYFSDKVYFTVTVNDKTSVDYSFDCEAELSQYYISKGKTVYITSKGAYTNNDFDWYFPEEYAKYFDYEVTGLHPISTTEVAVFTQDNIYYIVPTTVTINEQERVAYQYYKSRIPLGCNKGSDIVTSYDGKYTIFSTKRGLVAMAYQDFVNSTEQALTFLSDNISQAYFDWNKGAIKLTLYKYWLIVYRLDTEYSFVYDMRNASWWPMQYGIVQQVIEVNQKLVVLSRYLLYVPDTGDDNYKDDYYGNIKWSLLSQKLHFNAINYYKAVNNITLSSVMTSLPDPGNPFTCNMRVTTYRKIMDGTQLPETMSFYVDMIRTFVKKLNYIKLGQFQYELLSDDVNVQQKPLSLTSIVIKYKTTGQVR